MESQQLNEASKSKQGEINSATNKTKSKLSEAITSNEGKIPDWKEFKITSIAKLTHNERVIELKDVKTDSKGNKYIVIGKRRYYERNENNKNCNSIYILKKNSIFIGDKPDYITHEWEGTYITCNNPDNGMENIYVQNFQAKYNAGLNGMVLLEKYKSRAYSTVENIITIKHNGKMFRINKELVKEYVEGKTNKKINSIIEKAMKTNYEFSEYVAKAFIESGR